MSDGPPPPASGWLELGIERLIVASRWLQVPLYLGLVFVLGVVVVKFPFKLCDLVKQAVVLGEGDLVLGVLSLVDLIMVGNLVVMVIISGYESFVGRITRQPRASGWHGSASSTRARSRSSSPPRSWRSRPSTSCSASSRRSPSATTSSTC